MASLAQQRQAIMPYVQRGLELDSSFPLIAYYCRLFGVTQVLSLSSPLFPEVSDVVSALLTTLESNRQTLPLNEAEDARTCESFALAVFQNADRADRQLGRRDAAVARNLYAAHLFLKMLSQFGPLRPAIERKMNYASWRATVINKALRSGEEPPPPPVEEGEDGEAGAVRDLQAFLDEQATGGAGDPGAQVGNADPNQNAAANAQGHHHADLAAFPDVPTHAPGQGGASFSETTTTATTATSAQQGDLGAAPLSPPPQMPSPPPPGAARSHQPSPPPPASSSSAASPAPYPQPYADPSPAPYPQPYADPSPAPYPQPYADPSAAAYPQPCVDASSVPFQGASAPVSPESSAAEAAAAVAAAAVAAAAAGANEEERRAAAGGSAGRAPATASGSRGRSSSRSSGSRSASEARASSSRASPPRSPTGARASPPRSPSGSRSPSARFPADNGRVSLARFGPTPPPNVPLDPESSEERPPSALALDLPPRRFVYSFSPRERVLRRIPGKRAAEGGVVLEVRQAPPGADADESGAGASSAYLVLLDAARSAPIWLPAAELFPSPARGDVILLFEASRGYSVPVVVESVDQSYWPPAVIIRDGDDVTRFVALDDVETILERAGESDEDQQNPAGAWSAQGGAPQGAPQPAPSSSGHGPAASGHDDGRAEALASPQPPSAQSSRNPFAETDGPNGEPSASFYPSNVAQAGASPEFSYGADPSTIAGAAALDGPVPYPGLRAPAAAPAPAPAPAPVAYPHPHPTAHQGVPDVEPSGLRVAHPAPAPLRAQAPPAPPAAARTYQPSLQDIADAHKDTRSAASALSFEDIPTAIQLLEDALRKLKGA